MQDESKDRFDELDALQGKIKASPEEHRLGNVLRRRHAVKMKAASPSDEELSRLRKRLADEGFYEQPRIAASTVRPWFQGLLELIRPWSLGLTAAAIAGLLIYRGSEYAVPQHGVEDDLETYRGFDPERLQSAYPDLRLAGHQFQIVKDPVRAEAEWKAALIEAGLNFSSHRSLNLAGAIELHIRLSVDRSRLDATHALRKAPDEGEWVVILIPESR
jgi:hypothetical protein